MEHRYIVGIDLGTTNCAVSYVDLQNEGTSDGKEAGLAIQSFKIPQLTGPGEVTHRSMLPSFLYLTGDYEITKDAVALPWPTSDDYVSGIFARDHGARVPARLVSSAKSWLCHGRVNRHAKILPWGSSESVGKVSPIQATAAYLTHIRRAWQHAHADDPELVLENQMVIITVPASFDEVARDLTLEAAVLAGMKRVILIEEPLAAFYSWLIRNEISWQRFVLPGELVLICDVGGGTTDFTLITLRETEGSPRFERLAVGDHLILGGDNMDLALARTLEHEISKRNISLTADRYKMLCQQCRQAKESVLSGEKEAGTVTLMGEGSRLIAGTVRMQLSKEEIEKTVMEEFFPLVFSETRFPSSMEKGARELGLPYETLPAITWHLGKFLERHTADVKLLTGKEQAIPDLILFNGGALKSPLIQDRIRSAIRHWFRIADHRAPKILENPNQDLAVSLGASYYGLVKTGIGVRVGSGSPRAYYLGIARLQEGEQQAQEAVCLVERGLDEGSPIELKDTPLQVLANQPVQFDVYSSSFRSGDRLGDVTPVDDSLTKLPPIQTVIEFGKKGKQTNIPVRLEGEYTEMGTLSLWCRSTNTSHRWRLQFQLRDKSEPTVSDQTILETTDIEKTRVMVRHTFSAATDRKAIASLVKNIASRLELKKEQWPLTFIRQISDDLLDIPPEKRRSPEAESRWMNLLGYCLRPGRGDGFDAHRIKKLWRLYKPGPINPRNPQVRSEWWVLWRRTAAGLGPGHQRQISQDLSGILLPSRGGKHSLTEQEHLEIWMLVANLEQLLAKDKVRIGKQLMANIKSPNIKPQYLWSLSRIGAREPLYGSTDRIISPDDAYVWCHELMQIPWRSSKHIMSTVMNLSRKTGDRIRDFNEIHRKEIVRWMSTFENSEPFIKPILEVVPLASEEENTLFGEALPTGLILHER